MKYKALLLCSLSLLGVSNFSNAQIVLDNSEVTLDISNKISIYTDKTSSLSLNEIRKKEFSQASQQVENLGVSKSKHWIRIDITNNGPETAYLLNYPYAITDHVALYFPKISGDYDSTVITENQPFSFRKYKYPNYLFDLFIPVNQTSTFYLCLSSNEQIMVPLVIGKKDAIIETVDVTRVIGGIYIGILIAMAFYNIFIFLSTRDISYFYYVLHTVLVCLIQATFLGLTFQYLWPNNTWFARESVVLLTCLVSIIGILFMFNFLDIKNNSKKFYPIYLIYIAMYICIMIMHMSGLYHISYNILQILQSTVAIIILSNAIILAKTGQRSAKFYLLAWATLMIGILIYFLKDFGILPYSNVTSYTMPVGSAIEVLLLSIALADKINILKKEKEESQLQVIQALKEKEGLITNQNVVLEQKVAQRTSELETAYKELQDAQMQLVSSEKMASLGQLTAGIAHEINNPINFVVSSITPLRRDICDIKELLDKYEEISIKSELESKLNEISKLRKEIDIDFVKEEIDMLLKGINDGATRTAEIVKSLRTFSRVDESDLKRADLNEGLASTIVLLTQQWSGKIDLIRNFGALPHIECYPGKLNQVFMNILNNAIQAILSHPKPDEKGRIEVSSLESSGYIVISIKDNGMGMSVETKKKIFDPFFTTKEVGKGTGLGLSITYSIIEKHGGTIEVRSELGQGAEFIIRLPVVDEFVIKTAPPSYTAQKN